MATKPKPGGSTPSSAPRPASGKALTSRPPARPAPTTSISPGFCRGRMSSWANRSHGVMWFEIVCHEGRKGQFQDSFRPGFSVASERQGAHEMSVATTIAGWETPGSKRHAGEWRWLIEEIGWDDCQELGKLLPSAFRLAFDGSRLE